MRPATASIADGFMTWYSWQGDVDGAILKWPKQEAFFL
jgi:hypothetical protein